MTGDGMCGVFMSDRVLAGWWRSQWKVSVWMWAGRCITGCGRGQVYKCECGWDHCSVPGGCLLFLNYQKENILHIEHGESLKSRITIHVTKNK